MATTLYQSLPVTVTIQSTRHSVQQQCQLMLGAGVDSITGSAAADELTGGFGTDTFVMTFDTDMATSAGVADTIKDFVW